MKRWATAAMMVRDHRMAGEDLKAISAKLPAEDRDTSRADARDDHKDAVDELKDLSGRDFDKKYIDLMVDDHEKDVKELERKAWKLATGS